MGCGLKCRKWELKARCGEWLGLYLLIVGVVFFWNVGHLVSSQLIKCCSGLHAISYIVSDTSVVYYERTQWMVTGPLTRPHDAVQPYFLLFEYNVVYRMQVEYSTGQMVSRDISANRPSSCTVFYILHCI